jgi:parvulin-like peptidyl-prolyl isomerase
MMIFPRTLLLALAIIIAATSRAANSPVSSRSTRTSSTLAATTGQTSNVAVRKGLPVLDSSRISPLKLKELPTGPDGKKIVALVNGKPISLDRFMGALKKATGPTARFEPSRVQATMAGLSAPVLDRLVDDALQAQYADDVHIPVTEKDIDTAIEQANLRRAAGHKLQDDAYAAGQNLADLREEVRAEIVKKRVEERLNDRFTTGTPTEAELHHFLLSNGVPTTRTIELRASHIVFRAAADMTPEQIEDAQARAGRVLDLIKQGMDFATAARQNSQDRHTISKGGDLGYFMPGQMMPQFEQAAMALQPGQVSGIVRTPVGFHIIKLTERHEDNAHSMYYESERSKNLTHFMEQLRAKAKIERFL